MCTKRSTIFMIFAAFAIAAFAQRNATTMLWTNRTIESVLAEAGKYKTVQEVNPNASNKEKCGVQSPYGNDGKDFLTEWAYSEFIWTHFYPVGNGRMAAMVAGGIDNEVIQINEDTSWDGSPYGDLKDEQGRAITTMEQAYKAKRITTVNPTSGSIKGNAAVYKEIVPQALAISNEHTQEAVQQRYDLESMVEAKFLGNPSRQRAYKSFVELYLDLGHKSSDAKNYMKSLDLRTGVITVEYDINGGHCKRETFASYPEQAIVTRISSDKKMNFSATLHTFHSEKPGFYAYEKVSDREVKLRAAITNGNKDNTIGCINVVNFEARMLLRGDGKFSVSKDNRTVMVKGGKATEIYIIGATNYVDYLTLDNEKPAKDCQRYINNIKARAFDEILQRHLADFTPLFNRSSLSIDNAAGKDYSNVPTEERIRTSFLRGAGSRLNANSEVKTTYSEGDNELAVLEFNYGKYLIISGSRPGKKAAYNGEIDIPESQPLNLTGKWNAAMSAGWNGKYTININTQMNYWAAQPLNIGECELPLISTFKDLAKSGCITAEYQYGISDNSPSPKGEGRGGAFPWVMHHNFDLWRGTQPIDNATAGLWPTGGIWLLDHAWQYYLYNKDADFLAEVYPLMAGAARFFTQFLVIDPQTGYLVTAASCSPEQGGVQPSPAMDTQLIRNLYDMVRKAARVLNKEREDAVLLAEIDKQMPSSYFADEKGKLAPNLIDANGLIQEWARGDVGFDFSKNNDPEAGKYKNIRNRFTDKTISINEHSASNNGSHRHCSHLWEIYPGTHLSAFSTDSAEQQIFKAFQKSVAARGAGTGQGWGLAWRISLNARSLDGEQASKRLEQLFQTRTSPNLFDQHPNFQIDGNYGATAGILEMLIQSHDGAITLLPAIPASWQNGHFEGFNTREGATFDLIWQDGKPVTATIHARETKPLRIRTLNQPDKTLNMEKGKTYTVKFK